MILVGKITSSIPITHGIIKNDISYPIHYENDMDSFLTYTPLISVAIVSGLFIMALMNFSTLRKNMQFQSEQQIRNLKTQSEQQIYSRIMDARLKLEQRRLQKWQRKVQFLQTDLQR
jgi:hypothetical protein